MINKWAYLLTHALKLYLMSTLSKPMQKFKLSADKSVAKVLNELSISLAISTYQAGRIIFLSSKDGETISQVPIPFKKPMGIAIQNDRLAVATLTDVQVFSKGNNEKGQRPEGLEGFESLFLPRATFYSGDLDLHDLEFGKGGLWAVNTRFSCLCTFDVENSFKPRWKPPFISKLAPVDKCHLNGLAVKDGMPVFVTALGKGDKGNSWRENITSGGILMSVPSGEIILEGLAMPHSPRIINGELYLLLSATGELIKVNIEEQTHEVIYKTNGFTRGLAHHGDYVFMGVSQARKSSKTFNKLPVTEMRKHAGIIVYNLKRNELVGEIKYENTVEELFEVKVVKDSIHSAVLPSSDQRHLQSLVIEKSAFWSKNKNENKTEN